MDTKGRCRLYADDSRLRRNFGPCRWGRWCQASVVGHSLRPAASVRCGGGKAVSRIRQSSTAGQPNTSGFNECPPVRRGGQAGTIKGKAVCSQQSVALPKGAPQQPPAHCIWFIPLTPKGNNARERGCQRHRRCPESAFHNII